MKTFKDLLARCKCGVYLTVNAHRDYYESLPVYVDGVLSDGRLEPVDDKTLKEMIARDTFVELQFYPNTPISSYTVLHYDVELAIEAAFQCLRDENIINPES